MAAGCTAYLTKPIKQEVLLQAIKEHSTLAVAEDPNILAGANLRSSEPARVFLRNCQQNIVTMRGDLERLDFVAVAFLGHRMRGAGGMFGFPVITDLGGAVEDAADAGHALESWRWMDALSAYLAELGGNA